MKITPDLFDAYLKCPTKCWLRATGEPTAGNAYADWVKTQNESYRANAARELMVDVPANECAPPPDSSRREEAHYSTEDLKSAKWRFAVDVPARVDRSPDSHLCKPEAGNVKTHGLGGLRSEQFLESRLHAIERIPSEGRGKAAQFIPIRFIFRNKLTKDDKLLLAFDAFVLSEMLGREVSLGKIIHGDVCSCARESAANLQPKVASTDATPEMAAPSQAQLQPMVTKVKTSALFGEVRKRLGKIAALLTDQTNSRSGDSHVRESEAGGDETRGLSGPRSSPTPPDLVLNRHCAECEFQVRCRKIAVEKDDLSLLAGMSAKERQKLRSKGIFTVTQLSYTFRPRRRPKRLRDKREKFHHSLKALAIREQKIHIVGSPELKIEGTPVYLDVEGLPDRDFYYLIGLRIGHGDSAIQHSLWADTVEDEGTIWREFLAILETVEKPVLIHYGSYETMFLRRMSEHYGGIAEGSVQPNAIKSAINLLSVIFAQVYFPTFSNGLKYVAGYLNFAWRETNPSGLLAVALRTGCPRSGREPDKTRLITYNRDDCEALELVADTVVRLGKTGADSAECKPSGFDAVQVHSLRNEKTTKWDRFKSPLPEFEVINKAAHWDYQRDRVYLKGSTKGKKSKRKPLRTRKTLWHVDKVLSPPVKIRCPTCGRKAKRRGNLKTRKVQEVVFGRNSVKRRVFIYQSQPCWCSKCKLAFESDAKHRERRHYSRDFLSFLFYQITELCIPSQVVVRSFNRLFGYNLTSSAIVSFKKLMSDYYLETQQVILRRIAAGHLIHADETFVSIQGKRAYVWVFATMREVVYLFCRNREGGLIQETLQGFKGVLVSDFYAVYDALPCPQQKCLIHLIRDLNTSLLDFPYDEELKLMVKAFADLAKPIIETVDRYGLKRHFLGKHQKDVDHFYKDLVEKEYHTEAAITCKDRFERNREKLFTFLHHDGVPWNNNNAEHAMKAFARLRDVIEGSSTEKGIREYLVLLSVCQTCKYMGVDFLDFLRSGEKDIHAYAESRRGRRRRTQTNRPPSMPSNASAQE